MSLGKAHQAAVLATVCLVAIQVGIGIVMKSSQSSNGHYEFSPSSSVTMSEFCKLLLSLCFFGLECHRRARRGVQPRSSIDGGEYALLSTATVQEERHVGDDVNDVNAYITSNGMTSASPIRLTPMLFLRYIWNEISSQTKYDICNLALIYLLVNSTIFACYKMSDPGTIALVKSLGTAVTALIAIVTVGTGMTALRWAAILLQVCGIAMTQYRPDIGAATYPLITYVLLCFHVFLGAAAGVYNQAILQRESASLHVSNIFLYATGSLFNLTAHFVVRQLVPGEPQFFDGYDRSSAILVIVSNVLVGLAITAVLKYADAIIKCLATSIATGILLFFSSILYGIEISFLAIPGTISVFAASYLYIANPTQSECPDTRPRVMAAFSHVSIATQRFPRVSLVSLMAISFAIVTYIWAPGTIQPYAAAPNALPHQKSGVVESPLKNTLAFIRSNHRLPERVPALMKYEPFFHTIHISMKESLTNPEGELQLPIDFVNLTHDQFDDHFNPQKVVAKTMKLVLEYEPDITGLLYFHFDAWIDPMGWAAVDLDKFLMPLAALPEFYCTVETRNDNWPWAAGANPLVQLGVRLATFLTPPVIPRDNSVVSAPSGYVGEMKAGCRGWADIYYVPRRFFPDYIHLANNAFPDLFHEVAVATIMDLTNRTRRLDHSPSLIDDPGCWGHCCVDNPSPDDIAGHICGHKFDHRKKEQVDPVFNRIRNQTLKLGTLAS